MKTRQIALPALTMAVLAMSGCVAISVGTLEEQRVLGANLAEGRLINETVGTAEDGDAPEAVADGISPDKAAEIAKWPPWMYNVQFGSSPNLAIYLMDLRTSLLFNRNGGGPIGGYAGRSSFSWQNSEEYYVIYEDKDYLSYIAKCYNYCGGAHGSTAITVGTLEKKTSRQLTLNDVCPKEERPALLEKIRAAVLEKLKEEDNGCELLSEPTLTENFCLKSDGWHFIFNEYEVACYACGVIEVVIPGRPLERTVECDSLGNPLSQDEWPKNNPIERRPKPAEPL